MRATLLAVLPCLSVSCMTSTTIHEPVGLDRAVITPVPAVRAWVVEDRGEVRGSVVRYEEPWDDGRFLYVVRNVWDQDLGVIDEDGRAWKRVPHEEDRWIGTGTVLSGVRQVLELGESATLTERPVDEVERAVESAR